MCRFSIVVPLYGKVTEFEDTLASVLRHRPPGSQIVVAHDGSYDDPHDLKNEVEFVAGCPSKKLAAFLNAAFSLAEGEITVLIRPGVELDESWEVSVGPEFEDASVGAIAPLIVSSQRPSRIALAGIRTDRTFSRSHVGVGKKVTSRVTRNTKPLGPSSWLGAYRTELLVAIGLLDENLDDVFVDAELALSINRAGFESRLVYQFTGYVESEERLIADSTAAHGKSSQRAAVKFAGGEPASIFSNCINDFVRIPFRPWRFRHMLQRLGARPSLRADQQFAARLALVNQEMTRGNSAKTGQSEVGFAKRRAA